MQWIVLFGVECLLFSVFIKADFNNVNISLQEIEFFHQLFVSCAFALCMRLSRLHVVTAKTIHIAKDHLMTPKLECC